LGVERISRHDNFFALGGNSLLAGSLINRIQSRLGKNLALSMLFADPILAGLAEIIENVEALDGFAQISPGTAISPEMQRASPNEQALWFLS
jgi:hypothetical protein